MIFRTCCLSVTLTFCVASASAPSQFKFRPSVGEAHKAHVVFDMFFQGKEAKIEGDATDKVLAVAPNGNVSIEEIQANSFLTAGGTRSPMAPAPPSVKIYRSDKTMLPPKLTDPGSMEDFRTENLHTVKLPNSALAIGRTWVWQPDAKPSTGQTAMRATYKVVGSERVAGVDCWKISMSSRELHGPSPASTNGMSWLSKATGFTLQEKFTFKNFPSPGSAGSISGTASVTPTR